MSKAEFTEWARTADAEEVAQLYMSKLGLMHVLHLVEQIGEAPQL